MLKQPLRTQMTDEYKKKLDDIRTNLEKDFGKVVTEDNAIELATEYPDASVLIAMLFPQLTIEIIKAIDLECCEDFALAVPEMVAEIIAEWPDNAQYIFECFACEKFEERFEFDESCQGSGRKNVVNGLYLF